MMAPYAIAHVKIGLKLAETGYRFGSDERVRVYLTNALEPWSKQLRLPDIEALAHESQAVNEIKRTQRFTVVIGNPPYSKSSQNQGDWIENIMEEYKRTVRSAETQIQALSDDYSKFLRLGHYTLEASRIGILSYITNNSYLDGPLFRDMRCSMSQFFQSVSILNLHGDSRKLFSPPEGKADGNVFDIQQGVAIGVFSRAPGQAEPSVGYSELWGTRQERYSTLLGTSPGKDTLDSLQPTKPFFLFIPVAKELEVEFHAGWHVYDVFGTGNKQADNHESYGAGFVTQQDSFAIGFSADDLSENVAEFLKPDADDDALWKRFSFCSTNQWNFTRAKRELRGVDVRSIAKRCLYRPFDYRFTVFDRNICTIIRKRITSQFDRENLALLTTRRVTRLPFNNVFVSNHYVEYKVASHDRNTIVFPLWIFDEENEGRVFSPRERTTNLNPKFLRAFARHLHIPQTSADGFLPEDIFQYAYAVFHSPGYRSRYAEFLKIDFPRVPLTENLELFRALAALGRELVALHLMESPQLDEHVTEFIGSGAAQVEKVSYAQKTVWIDKAKRHGFRPVPLDVWQFHIGGYQVCQKWLKDRGPKKGQPGRVLTADDINHYHRIVVALAETIRLMAEMDETINQHGGWPDAFVTEPPTDE